MLSDEDREALRLVGCSRHKADTESYICRPCADVEIALVERIASDAARAAERALVGECQNLGRKFAQMGTGEASREVFRMLDRLALRPEASTTEGADSGVCHCWLDPKCEPCARRGCVTASDGQIFHTYGCAKYEPIAARPSSTRGGDDEAR